MPVQNIPLDAIHNNPYQKRIIIQKTQHGAGKRS